MSILFDDPENCQSAMIAKNVFEKLSDVVSRVLLVKGKDRGVLEANNPLIAFDEFHTSKI